MNLFNYLSIYKSNPPFHKVSYFENKYRLPKKKVSVAPPMEATISKGSNTPNVSNHCPSSYIVPIDAETIQKVLNCLKDDERSTSKETKGKPKQKKKFGNEPVIPKSLML